MTTQRKFEERLIVRIYLSARMRTVLRVGAVVGGVGLLLALAAHWGLTPEQLVGLAEAILRSR